MNNADTIIRFLKETNARWCDDCLSDKTGITPRQQIHQLGSKLAKNGDIDRDRGLCNGCNKMKITNSISAGGAPNITSQPITTSVPEPKPNQESGANPWYWEGNVQAAVASHLAKENYKIMAIANTSTRESGKDIVATTPEGKTLWISVKGWPEKSSNTQARHWFSQALFDIILYRDESQDVELALAFPDGYSTYRNLSQRISWFQRQARFKIYWVSENGNVRCEG